MSAAALLATPSSPRAQPTPTACDEIEPAQLAFDVRVDPPVAMVGEPVTVDVTITEYPDVEHIWILNGPWRIRYEDGYPETGGVVWVDSGAEAPEAFTAVEEMCAFVRAHV